MQLTTRRDDLYAKNLFALLSLGEVVWYCGLCAFASDGSLVEAGQHLGEEHPTEMKHAYRHYDEHAV